MNPRYCAGLLLCALVVLLGACQSTPKAVELDANGKPVEYVYYTPTGSNIPVRVRKSDLQAASSDSSADQAALRRATQAGTKQDKPPGGN